MEIKINKGLSWQRWVDPIDSFVRQFGRFAPRWAIFCTYECEFNRLEQDILPLVTRRGHAFKTLALIDAGILQKHLRNKVAGRINIHPVRIKGGGVFHPKLVFLRAGNHCRVCFGSANITSGGMGRNLELWSFTDNMELVSAIGLFFKSLTNAKNIFLDPPSKRSIHRAIAGIPTMASPAVWSSLDGSFVRFLKNKNSGLAKAKGIHIISPAYSRKDGVEAALSPFPKVKTTIYTDASLACKSIRTKYFNPPYLADDSSEEEETAMPRPSSLHSKGFLFEHRNESVLWFGSANLTSKALVRPVHKGGNVEILVRTLLQPKESKDFLMDLDHFFPSSKGKNNNRPTTHFNTFVKGVVLSGEVLNCEGKLRLIIHTLPNVRKVILEIAGKIFPPLVIKNCRGIIEDIGLLLPELMEYRNGNDWTILIKEVVASDRIPVIVNIPLDSTSEATKIEDVLDSLLDDFLGRWPTKSRHNKTTVPEIPDDDLSDVQSGDVEDDERRLDEANHQGVLDRLAVKAAILKKRIASLQGNDYYRRALEDMVAKSLLETCEPHLRPVIKSWFHEDGRNISR